ncbi:MAG: ABC-type nitrate/sulfonate/bicarbonate transport system, periplasmic component [Parcubacteria group bacterium GW2011_GWA2_42_11]|nr:MAG: ABC-type nitrate/sulfonate/bicarbonate transport system, periplasmic component [Parcubacteria group bacterium GW2011_GWA2_42_11]
MKKIFLFWSVVIFIAAGLAGFYWWQSRSVNEMAAPSAEPLIKMRLGWQVPWAVQGQLVQILKHTDILKNNGLEAEFIGRTYGPELNEAALAGGLDIILTADQPAAALFSKNKGWIGIGRLMYNRTQTYVPPSSPIKTMADLKGKTIGLPIGAAAERITVAALEKAGLDPKKDVKIVNLDIKEQGPLVLKYQGQAKWGNFDALAGFDPTPAILESRGLIKVVDTGKVVSLVLMNQNYLDKNPSAAQRFLQALFDAYDYYRQNAAVANSWFIAEAGLADAGQEACNLAASLEPNLAAQSREEIRLAFTDDDYSLMQQGADFISAQIKQVVDMRHFVINQYAPLVH